MNIDLTIATTSAERAFVSEIKPILCPYYNQLPDRARTIMNRDYDGYTKQDIDEMAAKILTMLHKQFVLAAKEVSPPPADSTAQPFWV
jgi:hypothetical protein